MIGTVFLSYTAYAILTSDLFRMVEGILGTGIACPEGDEKSVAADFRGIRLPGLPPTHVLFLRNRYGVVEAWLPCHSTSLLVHCAVLPILPCYRVSYKALAVVNMTLPSPTTFYIIRDFTYSRSVPAMMSQLLPRFPAMPLKAEEDGLDAMSAAHATLSDEELTERAARVNGVYQNACVVAIADDEFWSCLDLARRILLNTFAMRCMEGL